MGVTGNFNSLIYTMDQNNKITFSLESLKETEDEHDGSAF